MSTAQTISPRLDELEAIPEPEEAEWLARHVDTKAVVRSLISQVEQMVIGDLHRALGSSERVIRLADASRDEECRGAARRVRAQAMAYSNQLEAALDVLREAATILRSTPASMEAARVQLATLHSLARLGRHAEGVIAGLRARDAFERGGEHVQAARAEINIGAVERMRGEPANALEAFARARPALANEPLLRAQLESNCAEALLDLARFEEAGSSFREALSAFERAGLQRAAAIVEGNLADLFARQGLLEAALRHFEHAQRQMGQLAAPGDAARLEVEYADALVATGLHAEGIFAYEHAIPVLTEHKLAAELIRAELGLGRALLRSGRNDDADAALRRAEAAAEASGNRAAHSRALSGRAEARWRVGDSRGARELLETAEKQVRDYPVEHLRIQLKLAYVAGGTSRGDPHALDEIVEQARRLAIPPLLADALQVRARSHRARGRLREAVQDFHDAIEQVERTRGSLQADRFRTAFAGEKSTVYEECVTAMLDEGGSGSIHEAFSIVERGKGRSLLDLLHHDEDLVNLASDAEEQSLLKDLAARRADLNASYAAIDPHEHGARTKDSSEDTQRWTAIASEHERQVALIERRLAAAKPQFSSRATSINLHTTMALLEQGTLLLEYFTESGMVSVIVCDASGQTHAARGLCGVDEVRESLEALHFEVQLFGKRAGSGSPSPEPISRITNLFERLHTLLLAPLEPVIRDARGLVIVPTGPLFSVPFHALMTEGQAIVQTSTVVQVPSASVLAQLKLKRAGRQRQGTLVVGLSDELAPRSEDEAKRIASIVPGSTLLTGADATISNVLTAMREKSLIHIASHGRFLTRNPAESGVRLHDGWLTVRDAHRLRLEGAHVTLSACDTGRILASPSDDAWGLVRGFLAGGASSLLLSLWALNDASALEMMSEYYGLCYAQSECLHPAEPLRRVLLARARGGANPLLWAPFVLVGPP